MERKKKVIYYDDPVNDDFAGNHIHTTVVDESFPYERKGFLWKLCADVLYYGIAFPLVWFFEHVVLGMRFVNKKAVRQCKDTPYYLYGNHTGWYDAFTPNLISLPRRNHIIVGPDTVSIKGLRAIVQMLGAIPIPSTLRGMKPFLKAVEQTHRKCNITIYPEAHIWPYYTGVRPFPDSSFAYAVKDRSPVFAFFTAYTKPRGLFGFLRKAQMTVYVSDPIYPDPSLSDREARKDLRDRVYRFMEQKAALSDYAVYEYIQRSSVDAPGAH